MTFLTNILCGLRALTALQFRRWKWLDSRTGLLTMPALGELGEPMLQQCQRRGEPLGVMVFEVNDLGAVEDLYGPRAHGKMLRLIGHQMRRLAGSKGLAMHLASSRFLVLMPGCSRTAALDLSAARLGRSSSFELDGPHEELMLVPRVTALCATAETDSLQQLLLRAALQPKLAGHARQGP